MHSTADRKVEFCRRHFVCLRMYFCRVFVWEFHEFCFRSFFVSLLCVSSPSRVSCSSAPRSISLFRAGRAWHSEIIFIVNMEDAHLALAQSAVAAFRFRFVATNKNGIFAFFFFLAFYLSALVSFTFFVDCCFVRASIDAVVGRTEIISLR